MIAADLLRIARDPRSGRLRNRGALAVGTRAALMAELALAGCLVDAGPSPVITEADAPQERILATLREAVADQPGHRWVRWFTHVSADREAVARALVDQGRWEPTGGGLLGGQTYGDREPDATLALVARTLEVAEFHRAPADPAEAVLAALTVICGAVSGRPRPRLMDTDLLRLLDVIDVPIRRRAVQAALDSAAAAIRKRRSR